MRERRAPRRAPRSGRTGRIGRRTRGALLLCCAAVLAAAAPGVALGADDLDTAGDRVSAASLATRAVVLAHTLADERDALTVYAAAGRHGPGLAAADKARADRQVRAVLPGAPPAVRAALAGLGGVRQRALAGSGGPLAAAAAYRPLIDALDLLPDPVTAPLGRAADAAAAQRGALVAALTAGGPQPALAAAARSAGLQEEAALAEFRVLAPAALRTDYDRTVAGADTAPAEHDLARLLDGAGEGAGAGTGTEEGAAALTPGAVQTALTARIALMRGVETDAATGEAQGAADDRDHHRTVLELRVALAVLCLAMVAGVLTGLFRRITRPLAALGHWAAGDPESGRGVRVAGAEEFLAIADRLNALTQETQSLRARVQEVSSERAAAAAMGRALAGEREHVLRERDGLLRDRDDLRRSRDEIAEQLTRAAARNARQITHVTLSLRTLGLVERQIALIEGLEDQEQDPDRLGTLFRLDHLATRMRRNSENLLVLTGTEHSHGATARPVPLIDVARAAVSEIEAYERVSVRPMPDAGVAGRAADDVSHLVAELLDNATAFTAPGADVVVTGGLLEGGEAVLSVEDTGIGAPAGQLDALNDLLADPDPAPPAAGAGMGLYVAARLAHRQGVRVRLEQRAHGGTRAVVTLPRTLVTSDGSQDALDPGSTPAAAHAQVPSHARLHDVPAAHPEEPGLEGFPTPRHEQAPWVTSAHPGPPSPPPLPSVPRARPAQPEPAPTPAPAPVRERTRATGTPVGPGPALPQRVPRNGGPVPGVPGGRGRHRTPNPPVDPEALRRTLGGLQRGLREGRRDAEREIAEGNGPLATPTPTTTPTPVPTRPGETAGLPGTVRATREAATEETEEATRP